MKYFITLIVIILAIVAGIYLTGHKDWLGYKTQPIDNSKNIEPVSPSVSGPAPVTQPTPPSSQAEASVALAQDLHYIADHFVTLAKDFDTDAPLSIQGIWVQSNGKFYAEYKNKTGTLGQILISKTSGTYIGEGYYSPSESGWVLQAGQGDLIQANAVLYSKNDQGKWVRKN